MSSDITEYGPLGWHAQASEVLGTGQCGAEATFREADFSGLGSEGVFEMRYTPPDFSHARYIDEGHVNRWKSLVVLVAFVCLGLGVIVVVSAQVQLTIDATKQPSPPLRARGPIPGSSSPGHSAALPIRLELLIPTGKLRSDGTILVDFIVTNVGEKAITLPSSTDQNLGGTEILTLWLTSDAVKDAYVDLKTGRPLKWLGVVETSAELYSRTDDTKSVHLLAPNETIRVHASSRVGLRPGTGLLVAHVELIRLSQGTSELIGTADSESVTKTLLPEVPIAR